MAVIEKYWNSNSHQGKEVSRIGRDHIIFSRVIEWPDYECIYSEDNGLPVCVEEGESHDDILNGDY